LLGDEVVGVCALIPCHLDGYEFELAKMGVQENLRGIGIGKALAIHTVEKARALGAKKLFLESNRLLQPALSLYRKIGFVEVSGVPSPYERSDIQMELDLDRKSTRLNSSHVKISYADFCSKKKTATPQQ